MLHDALSYMYHDIRTYQISKAYVILPLFYYLTFKSKIKIIKNGLIMINQHTKYQRPMSPPPPKKRNNQKRKAKKKFFDPDRLCTKCITRFL